jgi:RNA ligase (TIGR02306 family)
MRHLATVRKISNLRPIENADAIECAVVDGWTVVVKKGEFKVQDYVVFCEIDSWIPTGLAPFLTKPEHLPKVYNGVEGERLKTVKLRGQLSQGLILPTSVLWSRGISYALENQDVTEILGIQKWEAPIPAQLVGVCRGNFPTAVPKTDEERVQNCSRELADWTELLFEVSEKLDGTSCTFYLDEEGSFHVCSWNFDLKETESNTYWKMARKYAVEGNMRLLQLEGFAIQGEIVGEGIQKNNYGIKGQEFFVFKIYNVKTGEYLDNIPRKELCEKLKLNQVPVLSYTYRITWLEDILKYAEGPSVLNPANQREGLVFKSGGISFKAISNRYLLKQKEEL